MSTPILTPCNPLKRSDSTSSAISFLSLSSTSTASSTYSRSAYDLLDRLAASPSSEKANQQSESILDNWSAGNVRLATGRNLTVPPQEALDLIGAMSTDERFEVVSKVDYGHDVDDWKISFRRTVSTPNGSLSALSDSE